MSSNSSENIIEMASKPKALIIGAGVTGTYIGSLLAKHYGGGMAIELWDKGRGIGGRMATSRMSRESSLSCDLGAQYFSVSKEYWTKHKRYVAFIHLDVDVFQFRPTG